jgi:hypothetical protein
MRYHRGMARQCPRGHDGTKPGEGADDMSARHSTPPAPYLAKGKGRAAREEARGRHGQNPRRGRRRSRGHKGAIDKISRTGRCAVAGSIDRDPSRRLAPAGAAGIKCGGGEGDAVARARARGEGEEGASNGRVGLDQVGRRRQVGPDRQVGPERF